MAIPLVDDLIEWLYQRLERIGWLLTSAGLLLHAVMAGVWHRTGELPDWSASAFGIPLPHTSILVIDNLLTQGWTGKLGLPFAFIVIGLSSSLFFGRRVRQMATAEADAYSYPAPQQDRFSLRTSLMSRSPSHK